MPLIPKKIEVMHETHTFSLPVKLMDELKLYCQFVGSSRNHVLEGMIRYVLARDQEWKKFQKSRGVVEEPASANGAKAGK